MLDSGEPTEMFWKHKFDERNIKILQNSYQYQLCKMYIQSCKLICLNVFCVEALGGTGTQRFMSTYFIPKTFDGERWAKMKHLK